MFTEIGSFAAKTELSNLLRGVQNGMRYTITLRGKPVADLVPSEEGTRKNSQAAIQTMLHIKKVQGVSSEQLAAWTAEGRK